MFYWNIGVWAVVIRRLSLRCIANVVGSNHRFCSELTVSAC
jgi:hypothetical protein